jgi:dTDP-4-amino-4,6-dideoxygalactose transaminase
MRSRPLYQNCHPGTFGDCGVLSFYSTKNVSTGEGGMVMTNNDRIAEWTKTMSQHGVSDNAWQRFSSGRYKHYEVIEAGSTTT